MPQIQAADNGEFLLDGMPYPRGQYRLDTNATNSKVSIKEIGTPDDSGRITAYLSPSEYTDNNGTPFASMAAMLSYVRDFFFR